MKFLNTRIVEHLHSYDPKSNLSQIEAIVKYDLAVQHAAQNSSFSVRSLLLFLKFT